MWIGLGLFGLRHVSLFGRAQERDRLWTALRAVHRERRPRAVILRGPTGCGKSRLAEWLCERAHEVGAAHVLRGVHAAGAGPRDGAAAMVARHLQCDGATREEAAIAFASVPEASDLDELERESLLAFVQPMLAESSGAAVQFRAPRERHALVHRLLVRACRERPVLLWLDDVHWAPDSIALTEYLMDGAETELPVLVVTTVRDETAASRPDEHRRLSALGARDAVDEIDVGPLNIEEARALLSSVIGLEGPLAAELAERSGGNPSFAIAVVGDWVRQRSLIQAPDGLRLSAGVRSELAVDLVRVWAARVEHLLEGVRPEALELAAVLGTTVDAAEWREALTLAGVTGGEQALELFLRERLVRTHTAGRAFSFAHAMVREALEQHAARGARLDAHHATCAQVLESLGSDDAPARLGRHLLRAGNAEAAISHLATAAEAAADIGDFDQMTLLLDEWDDALEQLHVGEVDARRIDWWLLQAKLDARRGRLTDARTHAERALAVARAEAPTELPIALLEVGRACSSLGLSDEAWNAYEEAETVARATSDRPRLARARRAMAEALWPRGELDLAEEWFHRALEDHRALGNQVGMAQCRGGLSTVARARGRLDETIEHLEESHRLYEAAGDRWGIAFALSHLADAHRGLGELERAEHELHEARAMYELTGSAHAIYCDMNLGILCLDAERFEEAHRRLVGARAAMLRRDMRWALALVELALATACAALEDYEGMREHLEETERAIPRGGLKVDPDMAELATVAGEHAENGGRTDLARMAWELAASQWRQLERTTEAEAVEARIGALEES